MLILDRPRDCLQYWRLPLPVDRPRDCLQYWRLPLHVLHLTYQSFSRGSYPEQPKVVSAYIFVLVPHGNRTHNPDVASTHAVNRPKPSNYPAPFPEGCMQNNHRITMLSPSSEKHMVLRMLCDSWVSLPFCPPSLSTFSLLSFPTSFILCPALLLSARLLLLPLFSSLSCVNGDCLYAV